jgi:hypothetical protein
MKRAILILAALLALSLFAQSRSLINVGGRDGDLLLGGLTNNSTINQSNLAPLNNTTIDLSHKATSMKVGGNDGTMLLNDLTNGSSNSTDDRNISKNLSEWGSKPRPTPLPGKYDYQTAQMNSIIRMNHLGY